MEKIMNKSYDIYDVAKCNGLFIGKLDSMHDRITLACNSGIGIHFSLDAALHIYNTHYIKENNKVIHIGNWDSIHTFIEEHTFGK
jgi:hypothetical protein